MPWDRLKNLCLSLLSQWIRMWPVRTCAGLGGDGH